jgi:hypothetical protein
MNKLQDLFKKPDGSKLLDVKLFMTILDLPTEPIQKETKTGTIVTVFPVRLEYSGNTYDWELSADQMARIFRKTTKAGQVTWQASVGDTINVWYASNASNPQRPYYAAEPAGEAPANVDMAETAVQVFEDGELKPVVAPVAPVAPVKPKFVPAKGRGEEPKWDGTPRQGNFRAGQAGLLQALISNPNVNPFDEEQLERAFQLSQRLVVAVRKSAKNLEESTQD